MENSLEGRVQYICSALSPEERVSAINTLITIVQNVLDNPDAEQYRKLRTANKTFSQRVWRHPSAREFMVAIGWVEVGDLLVLPSEDLLQEALIELTVAKSALEPALSTEGKTSSAQGAGSSGSSGEPKATEYQERMRKLRELQKKEREEKKRIADQIRADRRETDQREAKASHGNQLQFGSNLNRFEDIGVDLNSGGG